MKIYADVDLYQIDTNEINAQELQRVKDAFYKANAHISNYKALSSRSDKVIMHISNYFKLNLVAARTSTQSLAVAIKHMPEECALSQDMHTYVYVKYLKQALIKEPYQQMDLAERIELIKKHKAVLNITKRWDQSAEELCDAITAQNLAVAYGFLKQIELMDLSLPPKTTNQYRALILSMQILNYMEVAVYMRNTMIGGLFPFATAESVGLYESVNNALAESLNKLIALPEKQVKKSNRECLQGMFFSCIPKKTIAEQKIKKNMQLKSRLFDYSS